MKRIVMVISSLRMGGAESVFAWLANGLCNNGYTVSVLTLDSSDAVHYSLSDGIRHHSLGMAENTSGLVGALVSNVKRIRTLRTAIMAESPNLVISFMDQTNVLTLMAAKRICPVVISERVHPKHPIGRLWKWLRRRTYNQSAALVVQTPSIAREYGWMVESPVAVVPNAALPPTKGGPTVQLDGPAIIGMGRLHWQKGFDLLIHAFSRLADAFPEWKVVVFGDGPCRKELEAQAEGLGLAGRVIFAGKTPTPHTDIAQGDIFALPSRFEGFPNALCEAMRMGLACIASDCSGGPSDLITDGEDGLLVPMGDVDALANSLRRLLETPRLRNQLGEKARHGIQRFAPDKVMGMWLEQIGRIVE